MKKFLVVLLALVMVFGIAGCGKKNKGEKPNEPETPVTSFETQTVDGIEISGMNMVYDKETGITQIVAVFKNTEASPMHVQLVDAYFYDENNEKIAESFFFIDKDLGSGTPEPFETNITGDITNAKKVEFKVTK